MDGQRQKIRREPASPAEGRGEASKTACGGTEPARVTCQTGSPKSTQRLMEEVCERENLRKALKRVQMNRGSSGIDGMTVRELPGHLKKHWPVFREQLLKGTYQPKPVKRVEIPKPDGGMRKLGIPTVLDRLIQQAVLQVLQGRWDRTFSEASYGFRPGRRAHQAVLRAQGYMTEGYRWVVDIDLEKFFDRVNHDKLMGQVAKRVEDKRLLKLIRAYLNAGVMENGLVSSTDEGTPQGGPLSPLLSNLVLNDLDRELERRGLQFVRYADDCNIYVRTPRAGQRVMEGVTHFIEKKIRLKVNRDKSAVDRPWRRKFLGFSFTNGREPKRRIALKALCQFKGRVRELTRRTRGVSLEQMVEQLNRYLRGWREYFAFCQTPSMLQALDSWVRRRLRCVVWKQWKRGRNQYAQLRRRGIGKDLAARTAGSAHGPWRISCSPALHYAFPEAFFTALRLPKLAVERAA